MSWEQANAQMLSRMGTLLDAIEQRTLDAYAIYVASTGDDSNPGTEDNPVQTFCRAVELLKASTFNVIYLRSGESFDTVTGRGAKRAHNFEAGTTILLDTWGFTDKQDVAQRATLTLSTEQLGGENASTLEIRHIGDMTFAARYIDFISEAPASAVGVSENQCALLRTGTYTQGGVLGIHLLSADVTTETEGVFLANQLYATQLDISLRDCGLHGNQPLIRNAAASCSRVTVSLTTADVGTVILDGGVVGENVLTNSSSITL